MNTSNKNHPQIRTRTYLTNNLTVLCAYKFTSQHNGKLWVDYNKVMPTASGIWVTSAKQSDHLPIRTAASLSCVSGYFGKNLYSSNKFEIMQLKIASSLVIGNIKNPKISRWRNRVQTTQMLKHHEKNEGTKDANEGLYWEGIQPTNLQDCLISYVNGKYYL